ncbi:uncharacterized protein G2W53_035239 [Senna tora]|uniref:Uncharacterized protein n=1 Tax=Senna tora TaxID=362788 RepID=A0A834SRY5_9FABA|nr:uncharacterized protein G2W53_035239 [Senna tora]
MHRSGGEAEEEVGRGRTTCSFIDGSLMALSLPHARHDNLADSSSSFAMITRNGQSFCARRIGETSIRRKPGICPRPLLSLEIDPKEIKEYHGLPNYFVYAYAEGEKNPSSIPYGDNEEALCTPGNGWKTKKNEDGQVYIFKTEINNNMPKSGFISSSTTSSPHPIPVISPLPWDTCYTC